MRTRLKGDKKIRTYRNTIEKTKNKMKGSGILLLKTKAT